MVQELKKAKRSRMEVQDAIRLAAVTEFALHGLRGATTKSIAERAELSKAQLHYYIESKEALYIELLQLVVSEWSRESFQERDGDPAQMLASYVKRKLVFSFREPLLSKMFANELISGAKVLRSMLTDPRAREPSDRYAGKVDRRWKDPIARSVAAANAHLGCHAALC